MAKKQKKKSSNKKDNPINKLLSRLLLVIVISSILYLLYVNYMNLTPDTFEHSGITWKQVEYDGIISYYPEEYVEVETPSIILSIDPRENSVESIGNFSLFSSEGYISLSPEIENCGRETEKKIEQLEIFALENTYLENISFATTSYEKAKVENGSIYKSCFNSLHTSIISIEIGDSLLVQEKRNDYCYRVKMSDCLDFAPIEKFVTEIITRGEIE